ncbi:glycosyltransferase (GT4) [Formosa agariphila KMM 3901]|uniref:Glycosyltransferase (GT4) n=1 Tax=Formosa agariphila (strain DSM 15362 / KCTC 12365 / LMG 23005 / KMM 3901 / M-2Alg 35-1) TaxID=1347342 RepID=T2KNF8_FORAG|nr:glycosyltransferase family 4 protein [Formosa agariphila]CDF79998.1 glycosyltransferase (GT4) [Formosa agariphila KMM 3901]
MEKKRILIVASHSGSLIHFRGDFIENLVKNDFEVYTAAPDYPIEIKEKLITLGATPIAFKLQRTGLNPFNDLKSISELKSIIKNNNIDLVFPYTVKPVIYSSIAANSCNIPVISLITGLGFAFTGLTFKARTLQRLNEFLYKISIRKNKVIVFQNKDDYQLFLDRKILSKDNKVDFVSGSGVNLNRYEYRVNNNLSDKISFLLVARLIKEKGIELYIEAAKVLKQKYPNAEFHIIGEPDQSPSAIKLENLLTLNKEGIIVYHGKQNNVPDHLYKRDVFVLPTYYREGIPRSILEALSVGLPIITTNTPGCKETIKKDFNGVLIKPNNLDELINSMEFFIINPHKVKEMGVNSRTYAEERFDVEIINNDLTSLIKNEIYG